MRPLGLCLVRREGRAVTPCCFQRAYIINVRAVGPRYTPRSIRVLCLFENGNEVYRERLSLVRFDRSWIVDKASPQ